MEYQSVILSDVKKKNRESFRMMSVGYIIMWVVAGANIMLHYPENMIGNGVLLSGITIFLIMLSGVIHLSGITYTILKKESNYFETEKLKLIDADYAVATILGNDCRMGKLYVYGYFEMDFLVMVPIQQIESVQVKYWLNKPPEYMLIMNKHNRGRYMIGPFEYKTDALQIANQIVERNPGIIMK